MNQGMNQYPMMNNQNPTGNQYPNQMGQNMMNPNMVNPYQMNPMMMNPMNNQAMLAKMQQILNASDNNKQNNINNHQLPQNNNINMVTDGSPNFTGMRIDGEYLREQEDIYSIDKILAEMKLNKKQFYIAVNARIRQLAIEVQRATNAFELKKQQNPDYNNQNEQVAIVKKMEAVRDLSRIIKFYFKEQSEKDATQCRDYTNMDFDGLNGWIPAYTDSKGENHPGKLSFWDPINHSAIDITEDELATTDIPFLGHENQYSNCWFNAFNSMISHIPSFYLYFLKLGKRISVKFPQEKNDIKSKFPLSYEIAMYMKRVNDSKGSGKQCHETLNFVREVVKILGLSDGVNDVDDYKRTMMLRLDDELGISVSKNLPQSSEIPNDKNSISVYTNLCKSTDSSLMSKMFYTYSVSLRKCRNSYTHTAIAFDTAGNGYKFNNCQGKFGQNPTLSKFLTHFNNKVNLTGANQIYCNDCKKLADADSWSSAQLFSSESTLTVISIQPEKQEQFKNNVWHEFSSAYPKQIKNPKQMPAFVKSGNSYFELISIGTHLDKGCTPSGDFDAPHWVSYVKDTKKNEWHFCDDKNVDKNFVDSNAKHEQFVTDNINQILQNTSKNGANYVYKKCDQSKYDSAGKNIKEDIAELAFDKNGKGITKSPLYLISAKAKNYALQKNNPTNEDFKSAVESFKNRLQDLNVGILERNGKIKQDPISGNQDFIINNDLNGDIDNVIDSSSNENDMKYNGCILNKCNTKYTAGRKAVFIFSGIFAVAAIISAVVGAILAIKALTTIFIIAAILSVVFLLAGCFYNQLKKAVESCLPCVGGLDSDYESNKTPEYLVSQYKSKGNYDYNAIDNGNPLYEQK